MEPRPYVIVKTGWKKLSTTICSA